MSLKALCSWALANVLYGLCETSAGIRGGVDDELAVIQ